MSKKRPKETTVSETLRQTIRDSQDRGISLYRIAKDAKVSYATLHRFVAGERSLRMEAIDKLCGALRLSLRPD